jgi:hypothetical protein
VIFKNLASSLSPDRGVLYDVDRIIHCLKGNPIVSREKKHKVHSHAVNL